MTNATDPTQSRTIRDDYSRLLKRIAGRFRADVNSIIRQVVSQPEVQVFATNRSFDSTRVLQSLRTNITQDEAMTLAQVIRFQSRQGVNLALKQMGIKAQVRRGVTGQFINEGTYRILLGINIRKVVTIQQNYIKNLELLISRFIGGGTLTWNQLKKGIKRLGTLNDKEAERIARTEVIRTISTFQKETLTNSGVKRWKWVTAADEKVCQYCGPLDGRTVNVGDSFSLFRGQPVINSPIHPFCRCSQVAVI
jgi:SPP1 gp7 family putative phage head morphogenesis protein